MNKERIIKGIIYSVFVVLIVFLGYRFLTPSREVHDETGPRGMVLFLSNRCPHCEIVRKYIVRNKLHEKITFSTKEVSHSVANVNALASLIRSSCPQYAKNIAVPMLWTGKECVMGDATIINYFNQQLDLVSK